MPEISLNTWGQKGGGKTTSQSLQIGSVLGHSFNTKPGHLPLCVSFHILLVQNPKIIQRCKATITSGLLSASVSPWACILCSAFPGKCSSHSKSLYSPQESSSSVFFFSFPHFWVCFPLPHLLPLTPGSYVQYIFKCFSRDVTWKTAAHPEDGGQQKSVSASVPQGNTELVKTQPKYYQNKNSVARPHSQHQQIIPRTRATVPITTTELGNGVW